ncbi:helix-turn-helix domain-containing protein [Chryseobacterium flavum]|uniref:helix-turn-helix domain-containing protein n=1 Tax=Chryseobacterium flavum TaxID=415851 RepID=UPI0028AA159E|nr:AraC family transcriptional regulator [Chryseobacterium flavum]
MYLNTEQLDQIGFNIDWLGSILSNKSRVKEFNTLGFFWIYIILEDLEVNIENLSYYIKEKSVVFVGPHKKVAFNIFNEKQVIAIAFSQTFYERSIKDSLFLNSELFYNYDSNLFIAPLFEIEEIKRNFIERLRFFKTKEQNLYIAVAHNLIEKLILDAFIYLPVKQLNNEVSPDYLYYVNRFILLLHRDYKEKKKVIYYADQLHISSKKLSEMTEIILGKTAKQIIIEKLINEYKKLKNYSNHNISEICYELGFSNEGNFSNFIKKHTGKTPSEF